MDPECHWTISISYYSWSKLWRTQTPMILCYDEFHQKSFLVHEWTQNVRESTQSCIHCIISSNGKRILRLLRKATHSSIPNEAVHGNFLYKKTSQEWNIKYLLLMKYDCSSYKRLTTSNSADSDKAPSAFKTWFACFGSMRWLVTNKDHTLSLCYRPV